jgi:hypothetical protein
MEMLPVTELTGAWTRTLPIEGELCCDWSRMFAGAAGAHRVGHRDRAVGRHQHDRAGAQRRGREPASEVVEVGVVVLSAATWLTEKIATDAHRDRRVLQQD